MGKTLSTQHKQYGLLKLKNENEQFKKMCSCFVSFLFGVVQVSSVSTVSQFGKVHRGKIRNNFLFI